VRRLVRRLVARLVERLVFLAFSRRPLDYELVIPTKYSKALMGKGAIYSRLCSSSVNSCISDVSLASLSLELLYGIRFASSLVSSVSARSLSLGTLALVYHGFGNQLKFSGYY
jgi:hypothetical protein